MQRNWHFRRRFVAVRGPTDVTAPVLSAPVALPLGDTTGYLAAITNEANGTLYWVLTTSATPPSAAQVKAGQDHTGAAAAAAGNQAVSAIGYQLITATGLTSNTAYYAYFMQQDAIGNQSAVLASSTFTTLTTGTSDTSFDNLIAAMVVPPNNFRKANIAQMIQQLYAGGVWAKMDILYVLAAHDSQAAGLNWKAPGSFAMTAVNSPTFTTDRGYNGNGSTSYIDSGWDAATDGVGFTQNSAHIGVYARTNSSIGSTGFGTTLLLRNQVVAASTGSNSRMRVNSDTLGANPTANGTLPLHRIGSRRASSATVVPLLDGVAEAGLALTSSATTTSDFVIGRANNTSYGNAQIAAAHAGDAVDDTEGLAIYNALHTYMVAVGADT